MSHIPQCLTVRHPRWYGHHQLSYPPLASLINLENLDGFVDTFGRLHERDVTVCLDSSSKLEVLEDVIEGVHEAPHSASPSSVKLSENLSEQLLRIDIALVFPSHSALTTSSLAEASLASRIKSSSKWILTSRTSTSSRGSRPEIVVLRSLRVITKHFIRLRDLLELLHGMRIILIGVWMIFFGKLIVGLLDVFLV